MSNTEDHKRRFIKEISEFQGNLNYNFPAFDTDNFCFPPNHILDLL